MDKKSFVEKVSKSINQKKCELFIGSGISSASGVQSWSNFLKPFADDIGLKLTDADDLPLIAQYIVNNNSGNRNIISSSIIEIFNSNYSLNDNHHAISSINVDTIWTTNYDCLIEKSIKTRQVRVLASDRDLGRPKTKDELEIIKIHGCVQSSPNDIVLTTEDYEKFSFNKPGLAHRLRATLADKSILFIGYGYRDPNIRTIMVEASKLINDNSLVHYIILNKPVQGKSETDDNFSQRLLRFKLWVKELNRLGITDLLIENHGELPHVLEQINIASRGNSVYITGSHMDENDKYFVNLGEDLSKISKLTLVNGQSEGVGSFTLRGFQYRLVSDKIEIGNRISIYPNPYAANKFYSNDVSLIPFLKKERERMLSQVRIFVPFGGDIGTQAEIEVALENKCIIIPGIIDKNCYSNENIVKLLNNSIVMDYLKLNIADYHEILVQKKLPKQSDLINAINKVI